MSKLTSSISEEELSLLKEKVLHALLNNTPLPGSSKSVAFPDLPFVLTQSEIYLVDENVKHNIRIEKLNKTVQVVSKEFIAQERNESGKIIYFQFQKTESGTDTISLTVQAKVYSASNQQDATLTSMQLQFQKTANSWEMMDEPTSLSA